MLADVSDLMKDNSNIIEKLDFIFYKGKLSLAYDGVELNINLQGRIVIGEAGESCAFYIAQKLGMPDSMLKIAVKEAYGDKVPADLVFDKQKEVLKKEPIKSIEKKRNFSNDQTEAKKFNLGDSVMVYPDKKLGIICQTANEKGALQVQLSGKKIWINHKRVKLQVPASQLYPEDYDFSIILDTVENRKLRHQMDRKYTEGEILLDDK